MATPNNVQIDHSLSLRFDENPGPTQGKSVTYRRPIVRIGETWDSGHRRWRGGEAHHRSLRQSNDVAKGRSQDKDTQAVVARRARPDSHPKPILRNARNAWLIHEPLSSCGS